MNFFIYTWVLQASCIFSHLKTVVGRGERNLLWCWSRGFTRWLFWVLAAALERPQKVWFAFSSQFAVFIIKLMPCDITDYSVHGSHYNWVIKRKNHFPFHWLHERFTHTLFFPLPFSPSLFWKCHFLKWSIYYWSLWTESLNNFYLV